MRCYKAGAVLGRARAASAEGAGERPHLFQASRVGGRGLGCTVLSQGRVHENKTQ